MKITSRIKLALPSFLMGAFVALGAMAYASEPAHVIPTSKAGIHCEAYTKAGETFDCTKLSADGSVTEVTTFLVSADSNGSLVYAELVPTDSVDQQKGNSDSGDSVISSNTTSDTIVVDTNDIDGGSVDNSVGGSVPATEEVLVEVAEDVADENEDTTNMWDAFKSKAVLIYSDTSSSLSAKYHEMFPPEAPAVEVPAPAVQPEAEGAVPTVETPEATAPPVDHPLVEEEVVVVELPIWQQYANDLFVQKDSHLLFESEAHWLALNMVFEARNQGDVGTNAVADVTIMRLSTHYRGHGTIHDTVTARKQFSWHGDAVPDVLTVAELAQFSSVVDTARELLSDYMVGEWQPYLCDGEGATHYHKTDMVPDWQASMDKDCGIIGDHHFWIGK